MTETTLSIFASLREAQLQYLEAALACKKPLIFEPKQSKSVTSELSALVPTSTAKWAVDPVSALSQ